MGDQNTHTNTWPERIAKLAAAVRKRSMRAAITAADQPLPRREGTERES